MFTKQKVILEKNKERKANVVEVLAASVLESGKGFLVDSGAPLATLTQYLGLLQLC